MNIEKLDIINFKSLKNISIKNPGAFTVFAGANASGKSNIFEAIELFSFLTHQSIYSALKIFGSYDELIGRYIEDSGENISFELETNSIICNRPFFNPRGFNSGRKNDDPKVQEVSEHGEVFPGDLVFSPAMIHNSFQSKGKQIEDGQSDFLIISQHFSRLFINNTRISRQKYLDDSKLDFYGSNLEKVLKRLLISDSLREELTDILSLWIPGLDRIEVRKDNLTGNDVLQFYESGSEKPFPKGLISDGTINILTLLVAIYQTDQPQFICIEEPENGLNPKVIRELVELIRDRVKKTGQHIWLSTHSESLVSALRPEELIIVDKKDGFTTIRQFKDLNLHGLTLEKAWLSNVLGGGLPW
jgi:predicted ATPase